LAWRFVSEKRLSGSTPSKPFQDRLSIAMPIGQEYLGEGCREYFYDLKIKSGIKNRRIIMQLEGAMMA
jgi:hypothetical protein